MDISILIPALRTNRWPALYESLKTACKRYKWELVLVSPFELPEELKDKENIQLIHDKGNVPRCINLGALHCKGKLIFNCVDDAIYSEDSIDLAIDLYNEKCRFQDIISMIYSEGGNYMDPIYWTVEFHQSLHLPGIPRNFKIANQFIVEKQMFIESGGYDSVTFEYANESAHDWSYRCQYNGSEVYFAPKHSCVATWWPGISQDHGPIHHAQVDHDEPLFRAIYSSQYALDEREVDYDNWKQSPEVWQRRFSKGIAKDYKELCNQEGYKID